MNVDDVPRLLRRYWLLLLLAVAVPLAVVAALVPRQNATYTGTARLLAAPVAPRSSAESAALTSQVTALATGRETIERALADAKVSRDPERVARVVTATGLGTSALVDLAYTDHDPSVAQKVTAALATRVVQQLDASRAGRLPGAIANLDRQIKQLDATRDRQADDVAERPLDRFAQRRLSDTERNLAELHAARNRLAADLAALGTGAVVAAPGLPARPDPRGLPMKFALAGLLGLALGVVLAGVNEVLRPRLGGAAGAGRALGVPVLGATAADPARLADTGRRIRLAAGRTRVSTVVVARPDGTVPPDELVERIEDAVVSSYSPARLTVGVDGADAIDHGIEQNHDEPDGKLLDEPDDPGERRQVAVLTRLYNASARPGLRRVCALDDVDSDNETERCGLVVVAGPRVTPRELHELRNLLATTGWPLLGVVAEQRVGGGR